MRMATVTRQLLVDQVYQYLRGQLAARRLSVGAHLNALLIAQELGISRTTVNKAIARLIEAGWARPDEGRRPVVVAYPRDKGGAEEVAFAFANQTEKTYEAILERILRGDYRLGEPLKERRLAQELGVNPVTVHRACEWLCNEGLLVRLRRRGWQVVALRPADLKDVYRVRLLLEPLAIRAAVQHIPDATLDELEAETERLIAAGEAATVYERRQADHRFHRALYEAAGSRILAEAIEPLVRKALLMTTVRFRYGRVARSFEEHKEVVAALRRRDEAGAVKHLKAHLRSALQSNLAAWERL
jgi:DNA-binding GntR family transcriptional regulator